MRREFTSLIEQDGDRFVSQHMRDGDRLVRECVGYLTVGEAIPIGLIRIVVIHTNT